MKICEGCFEFMKDNKVKKCPYCGDIKIGDFKIENQTIPGRPTINKKIGGIIPKKNKSLKPLIFDENGEEIDE